MKKLFILALFIICNVCIYAQAISCSVYQYDSTGTDSAYAGTILYDYDANGNTIMEIFLGANGDIDTVKRMYDDHNRIIYELTINQGDSSALKQWEYDTAAHTIFYTRSQYHDQIWKGRERIRSYGVRNFDHRLPVEHLGYDLYECDSFVNESCKLSASEWIIETIGVTIYENGKITKVIFPHSNAGDSATATLSYDEFGNISCLMIETPLIPGVDIITITQTFNSDNQLLIAERAQRFQEIDNMRNIRTEMTYRHGVLNSMMQYGRTTEGWIIEKAYYYNDPLSVSADHTTPHIQLYPNPATHTLHICNLPAASTITIYDMNGRMHMQTHVEAGDRDIHVHALPAGMYILNIDSQLYHNNIKWIKSK